MPTKDDIIKILREKLPYLNSEFGVRRIGLFGSYSVGTPDENSDIDVVVHLTKQDLFDLIGIKQDLEEILKYPIEIVSYWDNMNTFLKRRIDTEAVYV